MSGAEALQTEAESPTMESEDEDGSDVSQAAVAETPPEAPEAQAPDAPATPERAEPRRRVLLVGAPEAAGERLTRDGANELIEEGQASADVVVLSTRLGDDERPVLLEQHRQTGARVVVLAHTGGELAAADLVSAGAHAVLAEGNEAQLASVLGEEPAEEWLVDVFARGFGRTSGRPARAGGHDEVTDLPDGERLVERITEVVAAAEQPRVALVRAMSVSGSNGRLSSSASRLLRRRLASRLRVLTDRSGAELYVDGPNFAVLAPTGSQDVLNRLFGDFQRAAKAFPVGGDGPLEIAVGHASVDESGDARSLHERANRALQIAVVDRTQPIVSADDLTLSMSTTTELATIARIVERVERSGHGRIGFGEFVGSLAGEIAQELGLEAATRSALEFAGHAHELGKVWLGRDQLRQEPEEMNDADLEAYRDHPKRAADYLRAPAGPVVADAVRTMHERWDGSGFPEGLTGRKIPLPGRVLAAAVELAHARVDNRPPSSVLELSGTRLDPDVARVASGIMLPAPKLSR